MNTTTFCQSYIDLAHRMLAISQKPAGIEHERRQLKQESKGYVDYLEKFEPFFETYPALKTELCANLSNFRVGAFIEYQLDIFYAELRKIELRKTEIQNEIDELQNHFADASKEWLQEEESKITACFRYLDTANVTQIIGFLNERLARLKAKRESYLLENQRRSDAAKAGEQQAEEERKRRSSEEARRRGIELSQLEIEERRKAAQEAYKKQMGRRKKM